MWIALAVTAAAFLTAKLNLFNLEARSGEASDDLSQRLGVVSYHGPFGWADEARPGQNALRVISIDEDGVEALKNLGWNGWPPGYDQLAIMVEDLVRQENARPRAVFLDLLITGQNTTTPEGQSAFDNLIDTIGGAGGGLPSTVFSQPAGSWRDVAGCRADPLVMLGCMIVWDATPMILAAANTRGEGQSRLSEVAVLAPVQVNDRNYPLVGGQGASAFLYPATALYAADCMTRMDRGETASACDVKPLRDALGIARDLKAGRRPPDVRPTGDLAEMWGDLSVATLWSSSEHPKQAALLRQVSGREPDPCRQGSRNLVQWAKQVLPGWFSQDETRACDYTLWMGYDRIAAGYGLTSDEDYPLLLGDRLLVVGARFADGNDWVRSPIHGAVPGVFYHAMTADNLVELGPRFRRPEKEERPGLQDALTLPLTFILMTMAAYAAMARRAFALRHAPDLGGRLPLRAAVPWYLLVSLAILGVGAILVFIGQSLWAGAVVVNWLGVLSIVFGALAAMVRFDLVQDIEVGLESGPSRWLSRMSARVRTALDVDHEPDEKT